MDDQNGSILKGIKRVLGLSPDYTAFDFDIMMHINSVFGTLHQLGVGPDTAFSITGDEEDWSGFVQTNTNINAVKSYMWLKVRLLFDPPATSFALSAFEKQATELEWRLNVAAEGAST